MTKIIDLDGSGGGKGYPLHFHNTKGVNVVMRDWHNSGVVKLYLEGATFSNGSTEMIYDSGSKELITEEYFTIWVQYPNRIDRLGNQNGSFLYYKGDDTGVEMVDVNELSVFTELLSLDLRTECSHGYLDLGVFTKLEAINLAGNKGCTFGNATSQKLKVVYAPNVRNARISVKSPVLSLLIAPNGFVRGEKLGDMTCQDTLARITSYLASGIKGKISDLSAFNKLAWLEMKSSDIEGNITDLNKNVTTFIFDSSLSVNYVTSGEKIMDAINMFSIKDVPLKTSTIDNLLISLSKSTINSGAVINLKGTRSSTSDAAYTALVSAGATINIDTEQDFNEYAC
mgnify:CR=1 FL=1